MDSNYFVLELDLNNHSVEAGRRVLYFDGYMISEDEFFVSCDVSIEKIDIEQIKNASGEFIYVWQNTNGLGQREIGVCTDLFGFYSAFYHFEGSVVTISNSFKALKKHLDNRPNTELTLNVEYLAPLILSNYSLFAYPYALETAIKEIKILPANKSLLFKNNGVSSIEKFEIDASELDYDAQLEKGLAASRNRTAAFNRVFANSFKKLFMSGGKDSRATLAVLMSVLGNKDFYVHSIDPKKVSDNIKDHVQKDLSIANKISLMFGLKFCELEPELPVRKTPINFEESLSDWQNDFSNVRFNFQPAYYSYAYDDAQYKVQFRGAGGEIYRGYWSEVFKRYETTYKKIQDDSTTVREDAGVIFNALVPGNIIPAQIYNSAKAIFADTVATMPGNAFLQKIDQHYNFLRHRFHFAHGNRGLRLGELMYLPLIDRHFYQASLCLTHSQKTSGKLVFDIVDRINPYLNLIEYDSSAWSQDQLGQSKYLQKASILKLPDFKGSGEYHPKILLDSSKKFEVPSISNSIASSYNRQSALMARLRDNLQFLSKHPQSKIIFNDKLIKLCAQRIDKKQGINSLVGKTESIRDALVTLDINYLSIVA